MNNTQYHARLRKKVKENYPPEMVNDTARFVTALSNERLLNSFEVNRLITGKGEYDEGDVFLSMFLYDEILRRMEVTK